MSFEVRQAYTKADLRAVNRAVLRRGLTASSRVALTLVGVLLFVGGAVALRNVVMSAVEFFRLRTDPTPIQIQIFSLLLALFVIVLIFDIGLVCLFQLELFGFFFAWRGYRFKGAEFTYCFNEEGFTEQSPLGSCQFRYGVLLQVTEDRARYYLFVNKNAAYVLRKDSFTHGDPDSFSAFISRQTGKPVKYSG